MRILSKDQETKSLVGMWLRQSAAGHQRNSVESEVIFTSRFDFQFHSSSTCQRDRLHLTLTRLSLTPKQP